jgi:hypothetical protein
VTLVTACACSTGSSTGDSGPGDTGTPLPSPPTDAAPSHLPDLDAIECTPTLESLKQDVFQVACAFDSCHGNNNAAWGLYLVADDLEAQLVRRPVAMCTGRERVVPGRPEESFLFRKLADDTPPCGVRMPFGLPRLPPAVLSCVRDWITSLPEADAGSGGRE